MRGAYSLACITRGNGKYFDVLGREQPLETGDCILVFPDVGHRYGPEPPDTWDECFVIFSGPIFDLWRSVGVLSPSHPIAKLGEAGPDWCVEILHRLDSLHTNPSIQEFHNLVSTMLGPFTSFSNSIVSTGPSWLNEVKARLDRLESLGLEDMAAEIGVAGRTLQRQFRLATGQSPQQYRDERRLRIAIALLMHTPGMKLSEIAQRLGFADEFYFSRWFKGKVGVSPRKWGARS